MQLFNTHKELIYEAVEALATRNFHTVYIEDYKEYSEEEKDNGLIAFQTKFNTDFNELNIKSDVWVGEEVSPYLQTGLGIRYPYIDAQTLINNAQKSSESWKKIDIEERAGILTEVLERLKDRFFEIAYATMHTTGQGFAMAFQSSGPHACDRALEAIAMGFSEIKRFPEQIKYEKKVGNNSFQLKKTWKPVPRGISLVIACSTFPVWNSIPAIFASLITGNTVIVKPHPKAVLPIAIVVSELRKVLKESGIKPEVVQLATDITANPIATKLAESPEVKLIDYTGSTKFGNYIESLDKISFTEKGAVNPVIIHSTKDIEAMIQNLAFSLVLYSRQMCTAPQNIYISSDGVKIKDGYVSYDDFCDRLQLAVNSIYEKKWGPSLMGCIQNDNTLKQVKGISMALGKKILDNGSFKMPEHDNARTQSLKILALDSGKQEVFQREIFGPMVFIIKTENVDRSIELALRGVEQFGAITCLVYCSDFMKSKEIEEKFNNVFVPVTFNLTGQIFVNQHSAFSDLHVSGGNVSGNASIVDPSYITKRFVWIGNRYMI
ncbi:MAG: aldehyde dehydrogenase family protein [Bacteroidia bacterium]|nr:aldehyde dehydrogenase family protein [Bacteroidia bacterium]